MKLKSILILVLIIVFTLFISGGWGQTSENSNRGLTASGNSADSHGSSNGNYTSSEGSSSGNYTSSEGSHHGNSTSSEGSHHGNHTSSEGSHHGNSTSSEGSHHGNHTSSEGDNHCPSPDNRPTTSDNTTGFVSISLCSDNQCNDIVRRRMKVGEVVEDPLSHNSFVYVGNNKLCYSVRYTKDGCLGQEGIEFCQNNCFQATSRKNHLYIDKALKLSLFCTQYSKEHYSITVGEYNSGTTGNHDDDIVSSSTKNKPTILLGLSIVLIMFGLYI
ncbi:hypothetical protein DICPUDRAFT_81426 [Dictyostelium purpureum]|uniref:Uncharacterized protein n=1 Tax=Dictyostelium purpureum TaxID=5786 RepID=F0ZTG0_DICPU|nr:uncharacterized protein DICPUDRAFT_81426 [Dictyostelium purpureum]EGC32777.1 hypothetical protein DICPUDRAFT_81426 [Dictyostelium purpureum]|eukprot:XP_003290700.1 hypothetical protein DICPUDRAFT_81426 [Dictyostelium purpureum]